MTTARGGGGRRNKNIVGRGSAGWEVFLDWRKGEMSKFSAGRGSTPVLLPCRENFGVSFPIKNKRITYFMKQIKKRFNRSPFESYLENPNAIRK